jgi:hypothetical protein
LAADAAIESAGDIRHEDLARIRRTAMIEFEIGRCPDAPNRTIARACRTSTGTVANVRDELERSAPAIPDIGARSAV